MNEWLADLVLSHSHPDDILIGGQALAYWVDYFGIGLPSELSAGVTHDIDFLSTSGSARAFAGALQRESGCSAQVFMATLDDAAGGNLAKIIVSSIAHGEGGALEIDLLGDVFGFMKASAVSKRSVQEGSDRPLRIMHPLDCLASRIYNFDLPSKVSTPSRLGKALGQARLAISVVQETIARAEGRKQLKYLEYVIGLAGCRAGVAAFKRYGIDVLLSIDRRQVKTQAFLDKRLPQVLNWIDRKRGL